MVKELITPNFSSGRIINIDENKSIPPSIVTII
jgi:hypothetical protein